MGAPTSGQQSADSFDVVVVGGGIAGLSVVLTLPSTLRVALVTKANLGESNTRYAQGGLAAAVGGDDDPDLHLTDTLAAGAGLVDERATRVLVDEAREAVAWLIEEGARFDERPEAAVDAPLASRYHLTLEGAHSRRRVLHTRDATGAEVERALVAAVRARAGTVIFERTLALDLMLTEGICDGIWVRHEGERRALRATRGVVLANGGAGQLWLHTSNPLGATADGLALAWRAGAALADLEFVQFHPTVLVPPPDRGEPFLVSEAVRGEGAHLLNQAGERFMARYDPERKELAPRDVVARAILSEMQREGAPSVSLDLRHLDPHEVSERFPTIGDACARAGYDLARDLIPVAPAAHYFMGGVVVDTDGRTTVPRLYAVGEVSCTGVHGANRLASNSLLEGLVFGRRAARALAAPVLSAWPVTPALPGDAVRDARIVAPVTADDAPVALLAREQVRCIMWDHVSLLRDAAGLRAALADLGKVASGEPVDPETASMLVAAQLIAAAALSREESRGGHYRVDFPTRQPALDGRHTLTLPRAAIPGHMREAVTHA